MATASPPRRASKTGRTQGERSAATRERLLDATIACLVEYGYAGTTVVKIAEHAGVTRGAQVHHYPTKADLVTAALMHLAAKRTETAWQELARVKESDDPIGAMLDLAWELHQGPIFAATVEFWVAARTDPQLREHVARVEPAATAGLVEFANALLGSDVDEALLRHAAYTVMDTIRGLLVTSWGLADPGDVDARWRRAKARLRAMVVATMAEVRAPTTS